MHGAIAAIEYFLPEKTLTTQYLSSLFPDWGVEKIDAKTGITCRHIVDEDQVASDLAVSAAKLLFRSGACSPRDVDFVLLCTQSPDYALPTTACLIQDRLGIPTTTGALDFNLGCSGFVYGLGLAEGLIATDQARTVLLLTAETYTRYLSKTDRATRVLFGDGAAATLVRAQETELSNIGPFVYGTDGRGGGNLIVPNSGARRVATGTGTNCHARDQSAQSLFMAGNQLFDFAVASVPEAVTRLLTRAGITVEDVQLFVFHQANAYILEEIRASLMIPPDKLQLTISHCANTVSSTIPIALKHAQLECRLSKGDRVMLLGFGVGYSWAATLVRWTGIGI